MGLAGAVRRCSLNPWDRHGRGDILRRTTVCHQDDGETAGEPIEWFNPMRRQCAPKSRLAKVGAVAFSRKGDPATAEFGDAEVIRKYGDVPEDLIAL
jgi:hypothetical protein